MSADYGWLLRVEVHMPAEGDRAAVAGALIGAGAEAVQENGETLATFFPLAAEGAEDEIVTAVSKAIATALAERIASTASHEDPKADVRRTVDIVTQVLPPIDWAHAWQTRVGAHQLGALAVVPPWLAEGRDPARTIVIEPQMAFGTGEHPTTRGVVRLMQQVIRPGDVVADLGAGSAVLAIAAAKLGAARVAAIEIDEDAIANAEENVVRNGVADRVQVIQGDAAVLLPLVAPVQVILANIISSVITELLAAIEGAIAPGGKLVASGILVEERAHMLELFAAGGWTLEAEDREDVWWSALLARP